MYIPQASLILPCFTCFFQVPRPWNPYPPTPLGSTGVWDVCSSSFPSFFLPRGVWKYGLEPPPPGLELISLRSQLNSSYSHEHITNTKAWWFPRPWLQNDVKIACNCGRHGVFFAIPVFCKNRLTLEPFTHFRGFCVSARAKKTLLSATCFYTLGQAITSLLGMCFWWLLVCSLGPEWRGGGSSDLPVGHFGVPLLCTHTPNPQSSLQMTPKATKMTPKSPHKV